jgi:hypothetical protein
MTLPVTGARLHRGVDARAIPSQGRPASPPDAGLQ